LDLYTTNYTIIGVNIVHVELNVVNKFYNQISLEYNYMSEYEDAHESY